MSTAKNPAIEALHELRGDWSRGGDMGMPNGFLATLGGQTYAVRLELWSDDCLADLKVGGRAAARRRGTALAKSWSRGHWPNTGYVDLGGAEGVYGATWAWDRARPGELEDTDPADILELHENPNRRSSAVPANARQRGERRAPMCSADPPYAIVLDKASEKGVRWISGGCRILAGSLKDLHPEARIVGIEVNGTVQHVGALIGNVVYDAMGPHCFEEWLVTWVEHKQRDEPATSMSILDLGDASSMSMDLSIPFGTKPQDLSSICRQIQANPMDAGACDDCWKIRPSTRAGKKWVVMVPSAGGRSKAIHFGDASMEDFTMHGDDRARARYRSRHRQDRIHDPYAAGFWSWHVLWGESRSLRRNFSSAVERAKKKLGIRV